MADNIDMIAALLVAAIIGAVAGWLAGQLFQDRLRSAWRHDRWHFWRAHRVRAVGEPWAARWRWHSCRDHRGNRGRSYSSSDRETDKAGFGVGVGFGRRS